TGFFQSLVPLARPMKFSTPMGALSGKRLQYILPTVVSMIAVGFPAAWPAGLAADAAGFAAVDGLAAGAWEVCATATAASNANTKRFLRMWGFLTAVLWVTLHCTTEVAQIGYRDLRWRPAFLNHEG